MIPIRWSLMSLLGVVICLSTEFSPIAASEDDQVRQPNILFILVDDLGKEWVSCYGAEGIETPHIDSLAAGGIRFNNAYSMPQCTPTRVTLLTGQYPFRHGWTNHWDVPRWGSGCHFDPNLNGSIAHFLRDAGYRTAAAGKWQIDDFRVEPDAMEEAGFEDWCMWTGGETGNPPSDVRYWNPYITSRVGSSTYRGAFGPDVFTSFLIDFMRSHADEPMFLYYPMVLTHGPLVATPNHPSASTSEERHRAMVRYTDSMVGRLIQALEDLRLRERTIVIFTTDNGTGRSLQGRRLGHEVQGAKARMSEAGTAMPFIVNGPGIVPSGLVTDALTDFTDLFPTFVELAGGELPEGYQVDGASIASLIRGEADDSNRDWIMSMGGGPAEFRDGRVVPAQEFDDRVIRGKRYKLWIDKKRKSTAVYDLIVDPWEQHNLLGDENPTAKDARQRLEAIASRFPKVDGTPRYNPNPAQSWDRFSLLP